MTRLGFFTDTTVCIGCKACEVACKQWNDLPADGNEFRIGASYDHTGSLDATTWRHVRFVEQPAEPLPDGDLDLVGVAEGLDRWVFMSDVCKHCTHAGCLDACPTGALIRTEFDSVIVQADVCNGCGYCIPSCPFGVIDRDRIDGRAAKCTLCYDRLEDGLEPACAKACPTDSIQFGPYDELVETAAGRVLELHERGLDRAYLYGAGDEPGDEVAGGLGAFFLLTEPPESYGLPAQADSPSRENAAPATAAGMGAALVALGATVASFALARRLAMSSRDMTPALGTRGEPAPWRRAVDGARVALHRRAWADMRWSHLYRGDTRYATAATPPRGRVASASRRMREGEELPTPVIGPVMHQPVWTWEVPAYMWFGGIAAGSSFVGLAAELAGDRRAAVTARRVTLAAVVPCAPLLIADLGRPERFLNMLRILKPRSPMSMGAWCLAAFSNAAAGAVAADLTGRRRTATGLGAAAAALGTYFGSYTGVLLASTAVPVWSRSRTMLPPIFVCTATATGAAANRLALAATGVREGSPSRAR